MFKSLQWNQPVVHCLTSTVAIFKVVSTRNQSRVNSIRAIFNLRDFLRARDENIDLKGPVQCSPRLATFFLIITTSTLACH